MARLRYGLTAVLLTIAQCVALAQQGAGHTTQPVGNFPGGSILPTGQVITPLAVPGSSIVRLSTGLRPDGDADASQAVATALSPDGSKLLVLTSGWNRDNRSVTGVTFTYPVLDPITGQASATTTTDAEWVFVYHVNADGSLTKLQQINIPTTYSGITWSPDGSTFYVSGGQDDRVYVYSSNGPQFVPSAPFILLGHNSNQTAPFPNHDGSILNGTKAAAAVGNVIVGGAVVAGLAVSKDGNTLVAANFENDSISIVNTPSRQVVQEVKFFTPGGSVAQGEFPYDVKIVSDPATAAAKTAFASSQRDDQVMAVDLSTSSVTVIPVGDQPNRMVLSSDEKTLYVVNGNTDSISVIDTASKAVTNTISLSRSSDKYKGADANSAALSPDGKTLYVTLGYENAVAVVDLKEGRLKGRIPTGWYPTSVSVSNDGEQLYVCTFKSNSGANPGNGGGPNPTHTNTRPWPLEKSILHIIPLPKSDEEDDYLEELSERVAVNNGIFNREPNEKVDALRGKIQHIVYIIKENKTYDQVLGDMITGNGDPTLTQFPYAITPNHHLLASTFAQLDNFYDSGQVSGDGWGWSTYAETTDYNEKTIAVNYGNGGDGVTYDAEGTTRLIGEGLPDSDPHPSPFTVRLTTLLDPTGSSKILPGIKDVNAPHGSSDLSAGAVGGHLWDSALRAGKTVRNYGFFIDQAYYVTFTPNQDPTKPDPLNPLYLPISPTPFPMLPQAVSLSPTLRDKTDIFFRGFDQNNADTYLFNEWVRDMTVNGLPNLTLLRLPHDHFGSFGTAIAGLNTPTLQIADNDYAIGKVVETISNSSDWKNTAIFILEDDAQSGGDHVDSHRSLVYAISPYTKRGALISTNYNTVNVLRTIEDLLGIDHLNQSDANAAPMADVFTTTPNRTPYTATIPGVLCVPPVSPSLVPDCTKGGVMISKRMKDRHDGTWWAEKTKGFDFHDADRNDAEAFNRVLWEGLMGDAPYPTTRSGLDLRNDRNELLKKSQKAAVTANN